MNRIVPCTNSFIRNIYRKIIGDKRRMQQILMNLVTNAIKFTSENGQVTISVRIEEVTDKLNIRHISSPHNRKLWITVQDTGIGISSQNINKLFKPFGLLDATHSVNSNGIDSLIYIYIYVYQLGTGLGLYMCKSLVNLMGGIINCKSRLGEGTKFTFWIPLVDTETDFQTAIDDAHILSRENSNVFDIINSPDSNYSRKLTNLRQLTIRTNMSVSSSVFNFSSHPAVPTVQYLHYIFI